MLGNICFSIVNLSKFSNLKKSQIFDITKIEKEKQT